MPIRVATYNTFFHSQAFQSDGMIETKKRELRVSRKGETGGRAGIHHPKGLPRGRARPSGGARPLPAWPFGRWVPNVRSPASPVQADCGVLKMNVDVVCLQELSRDWQDFVSVSCFGEGWTTHNETCMNVLTAIRASAVSDVTAESIACFSDLVGSWCKHRCWRRALETVFVCKRSGRLMSVVNLHVISGSEDNTVKSSVVPGTTPQERERFKSMALKNTLVQAHYRLDARVDQSTERLPGVLIVACDMNLDRAAVGACLSEVWTQTNQALTGISGFGTDDRDWIISNVVAMEYIHQHQASGHRTPQSCRRQVVKGDRPD
jgi:hypothetical protein